ncbi:hypothetical protein FA15DRAFT_661637 [Coprinopsis marcescibilis]|uniref:Uncharacterized protein n=1 Tax=Coprinopsis marcescibilis TaxID=230819 RepID=A0A5C3KAR1_COPMA|nr:hypothetical protein FA15DRAFT_661637 [Coprinopsis marcescibilis]
MKEEREKEIQTVPCGLYGVGWAGSIVYTTSYCGHSSTSSMQGQAMICKLCITHRSVEKGMLVKTDHPVVHYIVWISLCAVSYSLGLLGSDHKLVIGSDGPFQQQNAHETAEIAIDLLILTCSVFDALGWALMVQAAVETFEAILSPAINAYGPHDRQRTRLSALVRAARISTHAVLRRPLSCCIGGYWVRKSPALLATVHLSPQAEDVAQVCSAKRGEPSFLLERLSPHQTTIFGRARLQRASGVTNRGAKPSVTTRSPHLVECTVMSATPDMYLLAIWANIYTYRDGPSNPSLVGGCEFDVGIDSDGTQWRGR